MRNKYYIATHFSRDCSFSITYIHPPPPLLRNRMLACVQGTLSEHSFFIKTREPFMCFCNITLQYTAESPVGSCSPRGSTLMMNKRQWDAMSYCIVTQHCVPRLIDHIMVCVNICSSPENTFINQNNHVHRPQLTQIHPNDQHTSPSSEHTHTFRDIT